MFYETTYRMHKFAEYISRYSSKVNQTEILLLFSGDSTSDVFGSIKKHVYEHSAFGEAGVG